MSRRKRAFLADLVAIVARVSVRRITWLRRSARVAFRGGDGSEILIDGADGFEGVCVGCFGTVKDDGFPDT